MKHITLLGPNDKIPVEMAYSENDILNNDYFDKLVDSLAVSDNEKEDNK